MSYSKTAAIKKIRRERAAEIQDPRKSLTDEQQLERIRLRQELKKDSGKSAREIARLMSKIAARKPKPQRAEAPVAEKPLKTKERREKKS